MGEIVACANQKGGVGKTTTVVNLATYLSLAGRRVLVIDLDPQGNATSGFGLDKASVGSSYDLIAGTAEAGRIIRDVGIPHLDLIPSTADLAGAEVELAGLAQRERRLQAALEPFKSAYDHLIIDCPPSLGLLTVNALTAADTVLIPIQCEYYALEGLGQLVETIDLVRHHLNPGLRVKGVLLTMFDARTNLAADVAAEVRRHLGDQVYATIVPRSVRLSEAPSYGRPIAAYRPDSRGAAAYRDVALEFLARDGLYADIPVGLSPAPAAAGRPAQAQA